MISLFKLFTISFATKSKFHTKGGEWSLSQIPDSTPCRGVSSCFRNSLSTSCGKFEFWVSLMMIYVVLYKVFTDFE